MVTAYETLKESQYSRWILYSLQISWFRRDKKLHETERQLFHRRAGGGRLTLHIRRLRPEDFGDYSCKAQNGLGEAKAHTSLTGKY